MVLRERSFWVAALVGVYAVSAALDVAAAPRPLFALTALAVAAIALVYRLTAQEDGTAPAGAAPRSAARAAVVGLVVTLAGSTAPTHPGLGAALCLGATFAAAAGVTALLRITSLPSVLRTKATSPWPGALVAAVGTAGALPSLARAARVDAGLPPWLDAYGVTAASLVGLAVTIVVALERLGARRLELGAPERLRTGLWLAGTTTLGLAGASLGGLVPPERAAPIACAVVGLLVTLAATTRTPDRVARLTGTLVAFATLGGGPALLAASFARAVPAEATLAALLGGLGSAVGGLLAPGVGKRLAPLTEPFREALGLADRAATVPDPDVGIERALSELRRLASHRLEAPCLFRLAPPSVITVDIAGYVRTESAEIPDTILTVAGEEPERVVRREVLAAASVRRPDVRGALAWMDDRRLSAVALLADDDLPAGLLGIPAGDRAEPWSLGEVRALRGLADRLAALVATSARLARALAREDEQRRGATQATERATALAEDLADERGRVEDLLRLLERRARIAAYAPATRITLERLEALARAGSPLALLVPPGVDALAWVAAWHLSTARSGTSLVVVDGRDAAYTDLELWRDEARSPLVRARGRTLVVFDPQALPRLVQAYLAASLDDRVQAAVVVPRTIDVLVASDQLEERLADHLGDRTVAIPPLSERSEDLRALVLDHLARFGARYARGPLGIEPRALALVAEHEWPGNDAELEGLLVRAAVGATGPTLSADDLVRAGLPR